jgi:hypothetical protein
LAPAFLWKPFVELTSKEGPEAFCYEVDDFPFGIHA